MALIIDSISSLPIILCNTHCLSFYFKRFMDVNSKTLLLLNASSFTYLDMDNITSLLIPSLFPVSYIIIISTPWNSSRIFMTNSKFVYIIAQTVHYHIPSSHRLLLLHPHIFSASHSHVSYTENLQISIPIPSILTMTVHFFSHFIHLPIRKHITLIMVYNIYLMVFFISVDRDIAIAICLIRSLLSTPVPILLLAGILYFFSKNS